jgi:hypothetical protein
MREAEMIVIFAIPAYAGGSGAKFLGMPEESRINDRRLAFLK